MSDEPWTKEQFEDHWYSVMPAGMLGSPVSCECGEEGCHGWQMKITHWPEVPYLIGEGEGVMSFSTPPGAVLHTGDTFSVTWTVTFD